ncbi:MAG: DUF5615 family PIN-like protein [Armatimonadetes bacterium]|nr:DUF5615 family PIN-like protein [Armatimonadota bacterium]
MIPLLFDEDLNNRVYRALRRTMPTADITRAQDEGLSARDDVEILEWAAGVGRVVVSHDVGAMRAHAEERMHRGASFPGLLLAAQELSVGQVVNDLVIILETSEPSDWRDQIHWLPL